MYRRCKYYSVAYFLFDVDGEDHHSLNHSTAHMLQQRGKSNRFFNGIITGNTVRKSMLLYI